MNSRNTFIFLGLLSAATSRYASAQTYEFSEVPAGVSLFGSTALFSVTDNGEYLVVLGTQTGPGSAFILKGRTLTPVRANAGDAFYALNRLGYLVGAGNNGSFLQDPYGRQTILTAPSGASLSAYNLNNLNVAVGQATDAQNVPFGFFWNNGEVTEYSYPKASGTVFNGNSDLGDAVGNFTLSGGVTDAFYLTRTGKTGLIRVPGNPYVTPAMINNVGLIVGTASFNQGAIGQIGWYMAKSGTLTKFDYGDAAPVAMPGPKGPLALVKQLGTNNVWCVNNPGWICGSYFGNYEDSVGGYTVSVPFVGKPIGQ